MQPDEQQQDRRVGRYQLVERLAVGGMAEVYLAAERGGDLGLDRLVVVKRILPHLAEEKAFVDMFLREARIVARITRKIGPRAARGVLAAMKVRGISVYDGDGLRAGHAMPRDVKEVGRRHASASSSSASTLPGFISSAR